MEGVSDIVCSRSTPPEMTLRTPRARSCGPQTVSDQRQIGHHRSPETCTGPFARPLALLMVFVRSALPEQRMTWLDTGWKCDQPTLSFVVI